MTRSLWRGIGLALLLLPLLPIPTLVGAPDIGPAWMPYLKAWTVAIVTITLVAALLAWAARRTPPPPRRRRFLPWPTVVTVAIAVTGLAITAHLLVFAGNPHLVDEMAQLLHARAFAAGLLALPVPPTPEAFVITHTWITDAGWISQYPPGQTALFTVGMWLGNPGFVNPVLGGIATILLFVVARGLYGSRTAVTAVVFWGLSAWVVFMSASYMNHVGAMVFTLAAWAAVVGPRRARGWHFVLAGLAIGMATVTRPTDGVAAAIPLAIWGIGRRQWRGMGLALMGGLPVAIAWGWINFRLHGDPLLLGYSVLYGAEHGMGFHTDPWGRPFTPAVALSNLTVAIRRLHIYLYEWPLPGLLLLGVWAVVRGPDRRADRFLAIAFLSVVVLYFPYWHSGFFLGPRFYFVSAPVLALGTARAWRWLWGWARRRAHVGFRSDLALAVAAVAVIAWGAAGVLPDRVALYHGYLRSFKLRPLDGLQERGVTDAIVLVPESFGARTIVGLWGMGARPGAVERAYRWVDGCDLFAILGSARDEHWTPDRLETALDAAIAARPTAAPFVPDWADGTLRLDPGRTLAPACATRIRRDLEGFTLFGPYAWLNPVNLDSGIVFVRELENIGDLLARWPGRAVWRFAPPPGQPDSVPVLRELGVVMVPGP